MPDTLESKIDTLTVRFGDVSGASDRAVSADGAVSAGGALSSGGGPVSGPAPAAPSARYPHILAEIASRPWAIAPAALNAIVALAKSGGLSAADYPAFHGAEPGAADAVSSMLGAQAPGSRYTRISGDVGTIQINGPIVSRGGGLVDMSGLTTSDRLIAEFAALDSNPAIREILLVIDSPGGEVTGTSEFAAAIEASEKPVRSYVYGMAASAAYWIASATDEIVVADTALVGSIGTVITLYSPDEDEIEIVSTQSPNKRPDASTDEGRAEFQGLVDGLAAVFIEAVARGRNTTAENVVADFGRGGIVLPARALAVGMVDATSTLAAFVSEKNRHPSVDNTARAAENRNIGAKSPQTTPMEDQKMTLAELLREHPEAAAEMERALATAKAEAASAATSAATTALTAEHAKAAKILASESYPAPIKAIAEAVIAGAKSADHLDTAVAVFDSLKASEAVTGAVADTKILPATPPAATAGRSTDGLVRTEADIEAAAAEMKGR